MAGLETYSGCAYVNKKRVLFPKKILYVVEPFINTRMKFLVSRAFSVVFQRLLIPRKRQFYQYRLGGVFEEDMYTWAYTP